MCAHDDANCFLQNIVHADFRPLAQNARFIALACKKNLIRQKLGIWLSNAPYFFLRLFRKKSLSICADSSAQIPAVTLKA